jgi:hypothetical protein
MSGPKLRRVCSASAACPRYILENHDNLVCRIWPERSQVGTHFLSGPFDLFVGQKPSDACNERLESPHLTCLRGSHSRQNSITGRRRDLLWRRRSEFDPAQSSFDRPA